jgi:hypothetical protein
MVPTVSSLTGTTSFGNGATGKRHTPRWRIVGIAMSLMAIGVAAYILYTPTRRVVVVNDLSYPVSVSNCGDPASVDPGQETHVDVVSSARVTTCYVYNNDDHLVGCLHIARPETSAHLKEMGSCKRIT